MSGSQYSDSPGSDPSPNEIRVVTWNIEHGQLLDEALEQFTTNIHMVDADLVLLQEMDDHGAAKMAAALGMEFVYFAGCTHTGTGRAFGNAILARGSISKTSSFALPHLARILGQRRIAVEGVVKLDALSDEITVWSVHAEVSTLPHVRQVAQYRTVADRVSRSGSDQVIVAGDFNTASRRSLRGLVSAMEAAGTERANTDAGQTFTRFGRGFELDQVFTRGFEVIDVGVVHGHGASDHDPVWVVLSTTP